MFSVVARTNEAPLSSASQLYWLTTMGLANIVFSDGVLFAGHRQSNAPAFASARRVLDVWQRFLLWLGLRLTFLAALSWPATSSQDDGQNPCSNGRAFLLWGAVTKMQRWNKRFVHRIGCFSCRCFNKELRVVGHLSCWSCGRCWARRSLLAFFTFVNCVWLS